MSDFDSNNSVIYFPPEDFKRRMEMKFNHGEDDLVGKCLLDRMSTTASARGGGMSS